MSLCIKIMAVGGLVYYFETRREETYLKKSRRARLPITILRWLMIVGFIAFTFAAEIFFIDNLLF